MVSLKYFIRIVQGNIYQLKPRYKIMNTEDTLKYVLKTGCSIARFGDGEFGMIMQKGDLGFQKYDDVLSKRLLDILDSPYNKHILICIPDAINSVKEYNPGSDKFWLCWLGKNYTSLKIILQKDYVYGNANATRFYTGYLQKDGEWTKRVIYLFQFLWNRKDIVIVEGSKTRMGVGNDLFSNCNSLRRIIVPAENAFSKYNEIYETLREFEKDVLILLAIGPTATVLAFDLSNDGYQALDVGHLDIQYEYFLRKANGKIAVEGKYVNEVEGGELCVR